MNEHEKYLQQLLTSFTSIGTLKSRESNTLEYKESFNKANTAQYARIMASFANNRGGYIVFGVADNPRFICGLKNHNFDNLNQEQFTDAINSLFSPELDWECGILTLDNTEAQISEYKQQCSVAWIYTYESDIKPIIALKTNESAKISSGDIYYRYRARTTKIKHSEMTRIINNRLSNERERLFKVFEVIRNSNSANIGIINYNNGKLSTPYGIDIAFDKKLVIQVLKKAKFIKEGSFNETNGTPVLKVTGSINLAEEIPVPEGNPDDTHPYIQRQLAEQLNISKQDLYALIWYFKMKESNVFHLEITTSKSGKTHKFSQYAMNFLKDKLIELSKDPKEFEKIRMAYKNRKQ